MPTPTPLFPDGSAKSAFLGRELLGGSFPPKRRLFSPLGCVPAPSKQRRDEFPQIKHLFKTAIQITRRFPPQSSLPYSRTFRYSPSPIPVNAATGKVPTDRDNANIDRGIIRTLSPNNCQVRQNFLFGNITDVSPQTAGDLGNLCLVSQHR